MNALALMKRLLDAISFGDIAHDDGKEDATVDGDLRDGRLGRKLRSVPAKTRDGS